MVSLNTSSKTLAEAYTLDSTISGTKQSDSDGRIKMSSMSSFNQGNRPRPVPAVMSFLLFSHDHLIFMNFCHDIKPVRRPPSLAHSHSVLYGRYAIANCAQKDMRRCRVMIALTREVCYMPRIDIREWQDESIILLVRFVVNAETKPMMFQVPKSNYVLSTKRSIL